MSDNIVQPRRKPRTKLFELHEVKRLEVTITQAAKDFIDASSHQGRLFPQALSEAFGKVEGVTGIELDYTPSNGDYMHLDIIIKRGEREDDAFHIEATTLTQLPTSRIPGFQAWVVAAEFLRLYRNREAGR